MNYRVVPGRGNKKKFNAGNVVPRVVILFVTVIRNQLVS